MPKRFYTFLGLVLCFAIAGSVNFDRVESEDMQSSTGTGDVNQPVDTVSVLSPPLLLKRSFALPDMKIEVNISRRELYVLNGKDKVATYPVAVGKPDWPTRTGN